MESHEIVRVLLATALVWAAVLNVHGPEFIRLEFERWGYPGWLRYGVAVSEITAAGLLLTGNFRAGAFLALLVLAGVFASLARDRAWLRMEYPAMLAALAVATLIAK